MTLVVVVLHVTGIIKHSASQLLPYAEICQTKTDWSVSTLCRPDHLLTPIRPEITSPTTHHSPLIYSRQPGHRQMVQTLNIFLRGACRSDGQDQGSPSSLCVANSQV